MVRTPFSMLPKYSNRSRKRRLMLRASAITTNDSVVLMTNSGTPITPSRHCHRAKPSRPIFSTSEALV